MAENLQEYYKRMAEAIDTQLEQKGKAALFYPVGSGSGRIVWAWINAHPDAAVIWVVPGETRRGMRLEEAKRIGQEIPPRVQMIHCEDNTPQRCLELAKIRPACIILDGSREFTAFPCGERVRWLQRFSPQAKLLGLIDTDQPVSCCLAEAMFQGAGTFSISGFSFPVMAMHPVLQALSNLFPLRHYFLIYVDQALNGYSMAYSWTNYMALLIFMMLPFFVVHRLKEALVYYKYIP